LIISTFFSVQPDRNTITKTNEANLKIIFFSANLLTDLNIRRLMELRQEETS